MPEYRIGRLTTKREDGTSYTNFVVSWWEGGKRKRYRLDALSLKEAEAEAVDVIRKETARPLSTTIADLWEAYRREKDGRRVAVAMGHEWKALGPIMGHLRPDQIDVGACRQYISQRRQAAKHDGTIWTELGHLRSVLRWAYGDRAPRIERPAKPAPRERFLSRSEIDRLLAAPMAHHIKLAILLMLSTAGRVSAILELTWDRVDMERGQINLRTSETGPRKGRAIVPINDGLRAALAHAKQAAMTPYVVEWAGEPIKSIKTGFNAAVKAASLPHISPHDLRRTAARFMAEAGIPFDEIAQFLGHTSTAVTFRTYARFSPTALRRAAEVLDFTKVRSA